MLLEIYPNYLGHFVNGYSHNVYLNLSLLLGKVCSMLCYSKQLLGWYGKISSKCPPFSWDETEIGVQLTLLP